MLISKTPLRISFAGGGTDFPEFYEKEGGGVISTTIDKYIYVIVNPSFDGTVRVLYSKKEDCRDVDEVRHDLVREALKKAGIKNGIEIATMADIPSDGTGLGSSSSLTVGLLNALYTYVGREVTRETLAEDACDIERNILGRPIGKQDQYIAAYGGLRLFNFHRDGRISTELVKTNPQKIKTIGEELMLFYTGITRKSRDVLTEQRELIPEHLDILRKMRDQVMPMKAALTEGPRWLAGSLMNQGWELKKQLAGSITNSKIDTLYRKAITAGATGGKISGAGGGGFLLLHCLPARQPVVREVLKELVELPFSLTDAGTVLLDLDRPKVLSYLPKPGRWD